MLGTTAEPIKLPALRQDIKLIQSAPDEQGEPRWMLFDPITNAYFQLSHHALPLIRHWQTNSDIASFIQCLPNPEDYDEQDIQGFIQFLTQNHLIQHIDQTSVKQLNDQYQKRQHHWLYWLIHNYLFIKVPLLRPNDLLDWLFPKVSFLFHPNTRMIILTLGIIGILLTLHQWDTFATTFLHFFTWQGLALYGVTLAGVKILHEFGHALVSRKHHCRVSSMGVAFLVMFPVLYTDTTDAWRLKSKRQRLDIVTAGMRVEVYLALIATFLWNFLPDGSLKSAAFFVATTSWITSLMVNLSPFLRFDGYYAFSDWLGIENLQQRSFALAKWQLRKTLFGVQQVIPEPLSKQQQKIFILYAYSTWLYRFFLFLGIAVLVYVFAFKVLGIILFLVEIIYFILLPIGKEIMAWWQMKQEVSLNRNSLITLSMLILLLVVLITPWQNSLSLPAILIPTETQHLYAKQPATITKIHCKIGDQVKAGQRLISLTDPKLEHEARLSISYIQILENKRARIASTKEERDNQFVVESALRMEKEHLQGIQAQQEQLHITAPFDGVIADMQPLTEGQIINQQQPLLHLMQPQNYQVIAYLPAEQLKAVNLGTSGQFIAHTGEKLPQTFILTYQSVHAVTDLIYPELSNDYHGGIDTRMDKQTQKRIPTNAQYQLRLETNEPITPQSQRWIGVIVIDGKPMSYVEKLWQTTLSVLIRESGF